MDLIDAPTLQLQHAANGFEVYAAFDTRVGNILRPLRKIFREHSSTKIGASTANRIVQEAMRIYGDKNIDQSALISVQFQYNKYTKDFLLFIDQR